MLSIFRTNQLVVGVLLIVYAALLHAAWFWTPMPDVVIDKGLGNSILVPLLNQYSWLHYASVLTLLFFQGIIANSIVAENRMVSTVNLFPGVFVVYLGSILPLFLYYSPYLVANVFLLLAIRDVFKCYRVTKGTSRVFNVGFWLGLSALFVPSYLWLLIPMGFILMRVKGGQLKDQLVLLCGGIAPLYLSAMIMYWNDKIDVFQDIQWSNFLSAPEYLPLAKGLNYGMVFMFILVVFIIFSRSHYLMKTKMDIRIKIEALYVLLLGMGLLTLIDMPWDMNRWQMIAPVIGILLSFNFTKAKAVMAEVFHLGLLVLLLLLHFLPLFKVIPVL